MEQKNDRKQVMKNLFFEHSMRGKFLRLAIFIVIGAVLGCVIGPVRAATLNRSPAVTAAEPSGGHGDGGGSGNGNDAAVGADTSESADTSKLTDTSENGSDADHTSSLLQPASGAQSVKRAKLLAVGDDLIHSGIYKSGLQADGSYNFDHLYEHVKDDIAAADLAMVNQETIFTYNRNDYSGYPCFAGPVEIGDALVDAGFDVVTHATNHTFDRNVQGIEDTLDFWKTNHPEITVLGIHEDQADADTIKTVECNGITFAMLNYTYGLNGFVLPEDQPYLVDLLDKDKVAADIARAKEISDCVIFFLHCGVEYTYTPSDETKEWVEFLLENGVDITIASHPHVLEPYAMLTGEDGHQMLVYYSMGNFISTQDEYPRLIGGMAQISVELQGEGDGAELSITDYTLEPLFTQYNHNTGVYTVYKFSDYTDELALQNAMNGKNGVTLSRQVIWDEFTEIMKTSIEQPGAVLVEQPWLDADISLPDVGQSIGALVGGGKDRNSSAEGGSDQTGTADTAGVPDGITTSDETESINETEY